MKERREGEAEGREEGREEGAGEALYVWYVEVLTRYVDSVC